MTFVADTNGASSTSGLSSPSGSAATTLAGQHGGFDNLDMASLAQDMIARQQQDPQGAGRTLAELEGMMTPVQRGQLASAMDRAANDNPAAPTLQGPDPVQLGLDLTQMGLDIVGIFEPTPFADGSNAVISVGRSIGSVFSGDWGEAGGHLLNAGLSTAGILPGLGDLAKAGKIGKWAQTVADTVSAIAQNPALRETLEPGLRTIADAVDKIPQSALDALPADARASLESMKRQLDEFFSPPAASAPVSAADDAAAALAKRDQVVMDGGTTGSWSPELNARNLKPNTDYLVNGYAYKTDDAGRVTSVEGSLDLKTADRNGYQQRVSGRDDRLADDQGGHLIASIFNGPGDRLNLVPMDGNFNMGAWKTLETRFADALKDGKTVDVNIDVIYNGSSGRPDAFVVDYVIGGVPETKTFMNRPGG